MLSIHESIQGGAINRLLLLAVIHLPRWGDKYETVAASNCSCYHLHFFITQVLTDLS